jgi:ASC-1-like (ASCH) protein
VRYLLIILLFASCNPLRHYQKVALDPFRNNAERALLAKAAHEEFPAIKDSVRVVSTGVDSSDFNAVNMAYMTLLDSMIAHAEREDTVRTPINNSYERSLYRQVFPTDSLRIIRNFVRVYKPPAIVKTEVKEVRVSDTFKEALLQTQIDNCRTDNAWLVSEVAKAKENFDDKRRTNIWLWIVMGLLAVGNVYQLTNRWK